MARRLLAFGRRATRLAAGHLQVVAEVVLHLNVRLLRVHCAAAAASGRQSADGRHSAARRASRKPWTQFPSCLTRRTRAAHRRPRSHQLPHASAARCRPCARRRLSQQAPRPPRPQRALPPPPPWPQRGRPRAPRPAGRAAAPRRRLPRSGGCTGASGEPYLPVQHSWHFGTQLPGLLTRACRPWCWPTAWSCLALVVRAPFCAAYLLVTPACAGHLAL